MLKNQIEMKLKNDARDADGDEDQGGICHCEERESTSHCEERSDEAISKGKRGMLMEIASLRSQ